MNIKQKFSNLPSGVKTAAAFLAASIISKGMSFITTPIFTRLMSSEEYGQVSLFTTWLTVLGILAMFSLDKGVYNVGMMQYKNDRAGFSFSLLALSNIITLAVGIIVMSMHRYIEQYLGIDQYLLMLMFAVFLTQPAYTYFIARNRFEYKYKPVLISSVALAVIPLIISVFCVSFFDGNRAYARIFGLELTCILFYIGFYIYHAVSNKFQVNTSYWKNAFLFNLPLIPHYLSQFILSGSDRIMISYLAGESATAYYSVAYSISATAILIWNAVDGTLVPYMYKNCEARKYSDISNICLPILTLVALGCSFIIFLAPEIVKIMAPSEYYEAIYVIPPIILGVFFQVHFSLYANIAYYYKQQKKVMISSITAATLNIVLNYLLIPRYGYVAAGYTTMLSYIVQAVLDYWAMYRGAQNCIYDMRWVLAVSAALMAIMAVAVNIYDYWFIRYGLVAIILFAVFFNRVKISQYIKQVLHLNNNTSK